MKLGIDLDEVLGDLAAPLLQFMNAKHKTHFTKQDIKEYDFGYLYGLSLEQFYGEILDFYKTNAFQNIQPISHSRRVINNLSKNNELYVITARPDTVKHTTEKFLNKNYPNKFNKIIYTDGAHKSDICLDLKVDYLIDDHIKYVNDATQKGINCLLMDRPWNQNYNLPVGSERVYDWKGIEKCLISYTKKE